MVGSRIQTRARSSLVAITGRNEGVVSRSAYELGSSIEGDRLTLKGSSRLAAGLLRNLSHDAGVCGSGADEGR